MCVCVCVCVFVSKSVCVKIVLLQNEDPNIKPYPSPLRWLFFEYTECINIKHMDTSYTWIPVCAHVCVCVSS